MMDDAVRERLRAIKSLVHLEDEAALGAQVDKLSEIGEMNDERVQAIADALRRAAYGEAIALIENVLADEARPVPTATSEDAQHQVLREEVEQLETRLAELESEEADLQRRIRAFSVRYRDELGPLVNKLLRLRKDRLEQSLYAKRSSRTRRTAFNKADAQFERFQQVLEETEEPGTEELSDDDWERLKATYRRASKLCHPDVVDASMEEEARTYFNKLREAYQRGDLERVEAIADMLSESGFARRSDDAGSADQARLEARAERLRQRIEAVETTIEEMRASKAYEAITSVDDLDAYFDTLKQKLRREIRQMKRGRSVRGSSSSPGSRGGELFP